MIRVVLDTNVLVSAAIKRRGPESAVLDLVGAKQLVLVVSEPILREYDEVLRRPKLRLDPELVKYVLDLARKIGVIVEPAFTLSVSPHEEDNRFLECSQAAEADFLVTGNKRHFPPRWGKTTVVNAREFAELTELEQ